MLRALLACLLLLPTTPTFAAESFDSCAGTITSLPATISSQGVWCLRSDLATAIASGDAITIAANNVTLDCNGFKLGGLAAGPETFANGVRASGRSNVTIRNCNIRGFLFGAWLIDGSGHVIANNRFDGNLAIAIRLSSTDSSDVKDNFVANTGGTFNVDYHDALGISSDLGRATLVRHNFVSTVSPHTMLWPEAQAFGISVATPDSVIEGNRVVTVVSGTGGLSTGIAAYSTQVLIDNSVSGLVSGASRRGVLCSSSAIVARNYVRGVTPAEAFIGCADDGGNVSR